MEHKTPMDLDLAPADRPCEEILDQLATGIPSAQINQHLERCSDCAVAAQEIELLRQLARGLPRPAMPRGRRQRSPGLQLLPALAGGLTLGLCIVSLWMLTQPRPDPAPTPLLHTTQAASEQGEAVDLFQALESAQRVWSGSAQGERWLALSPYVEQQVEQTASDQRTVLDNGSPAPEDLEQAQDEAHWPSLALFDDPLGSLGSAGAAWEPPSILEHI